MGNDNSNDNINAKRMSINRLSNNYDFIDKMEEYILNDDSLTITKK